MYDVSLEEGTLDRLRHLGRVAAHIVSCGALGCAPSGTGDARPNPAPHSVYGTVTDVASGVPVEDVTVIVLSETEAPIAEAVSDTIGRFYLGTSGPGRYLVRFRHEAYRPMRGTVNVPQGQIVEVRARVRQNDDDPRATYSTRAFNTNRCNDWSEYRRLLGSGRSLLEWRWRLCDHSDTQYEVQMEFRNPHNEPIEFDYRVSGQRRMECSQVDHAIDPLSASLTGQLQLPADGRARHRGTQGLVNKDGYTSYVHLCVHNWKIMVRN